MADQRTQQGRGRPMLSEYGRRWRALRTWFDDFPPDDQERLLGQIERLLALAQDRDMGAFLDWVDELLVLIERHAQLNPQAPERGTRGEGPREGLQP
jgi:hypothetical protein